MGNASPYDTSSAATTEPGQPTGTEQQLPAFTWPGTESQFVLLTVHLCC